MIQAKFWGLGSLTDKELQVLDSDKELQSFRFKLKRSSKY